MKLLNYTLKIYMGVRSHHIKIHSTFEDSLHVIMELKKLSKIRSHKSQFITEIV